MNRTHPEQPLESRRAVWYATAVAVVAVASSGLAFRILADRLAGLEGSVILTAADLETLPIEMNGWRGEDIAIDPRVVEASNSDAHLVRGYVHEGRSVELFIAYGVRIRELMPHRPDVCYPSAGWTQNQDQDIELAPAGAPPFRAQLFHFKRGGLTADTITVLNYYLVDGQFFADESRLREEASKFSSKLRYVCQVQISTSASLNADEAARCVKSFAAASAIPIQNMLNLAVDSNTPENKS